MRGRHKLEKVKDNIDFACAMGSGKNQQKLLLLLNQRLIIFNKLTPQFLILLSSGIQLIISILLQNLSCTLFQKIEIFWFVTIYFTVVAKEHGVKQVGSFQCLNGKVDLSTFEAEHTLDEWYNQLITLKDELSVRWLLIKYLGQSSHIRCSSLWVKLKSHFKILVKLKGDNS